MLIAVAAAGVLTLTAACDAHSPKEQASRESKAATVQVFKLHMMKDLWSRTCHDHYYNGYRQINKPKSLVEDSATNMVTIELTGAQMADYLQILDYNAHGGSDALDPPLATAVYDAVSPVVDKIQAPPAPDAPAPEITITAAVSLTATTVVTSAPR
ncbi:hypothetical protein [Nocardia tengchongensis]|uniref:hypothetical protein n=1 Tax=Nocardia tengchongensis TaxID=2055889 RepID=UPI003606DB15